MCFSLPLLRLRAESSFGGDKPELDADSGCSSEDAESTLDESDGTSFRLGRCLDISIAGVVENWGCAGQQNVSLFHNLQLRFSNRFPPSIDSAHFEKTNTHSQQAALVSTRQRHPPVHIPKRLSTFLGSTLCIFPASTVRTGAGNREGIVSSRRLPLRHIYFR